MSVPQLPSKWRWARNGAIFGLLVSLADLLFAWGGVHFEPWANAGAIAGNIGQFVGSAMMAGLVGYVLGALRDRNLKRLS
jgi:hypothetical protein